MITMCDIYEAIFSWIGNMLNEPYSSKLKSYELEVNEYELSALNEN